MSVAVLDIQEHFGARITASSARFLWVNTALVELLKCTKTKDGTGGGNGSGNRICIFL